MNRMDMIERLNRQLADGRPLSIHDYTAPCSEKWTEPFSETSATGLRASIGVASGLMRDHVRSPGAGRARHGC